MKAGLLFQIAHIPKYVLLIQQMTTNYIYISNKTILIILFSLQSKTRDPPLIFATDRAFPSQMKILTAQPDPDLVAPPEMVIVNVPETNLLNYHRGTILFTPREDQEKSRYVTFRHPDGQICYLLFAQCLILISLKQKVLRALNFKKKPI